MDQLLLTAPRLNGTVSVISEGVALKLDLLKEFDDFAHEEAIPSLEVRNSEDGLAGRIKKHLDQIEKDRSVVKAPFWQIGKEIDDAAKSHTAELKAALATLETRIGRFEAKRRAAAAAADAELKRKDTEAALKQLEVAKTLKLSGKMVTLETQLDAQEELEAAERQRDLIAAERDELSLSLHASAPSGQLRDGLSVIVNDPAALYKAFPNLVELKPRIGLIKNAIRGGFLLPGVTATSSATFHVKAK